MSDRVHTPDARQGEHWQDAQLTSYLLGELPEAEMEALDAHLARCASCRETLDRLDEVYVASVEQLEAPKLRDEVWNDIQARIGASEASDASDVPGTEPQGEPQTPMPPPQPAGPTFGLGSAMAALLLVVAVGSWGVWQRAQVQQVQAEAESLQARVELLEGVALTVQARADNLIDDQARLSRWLANDDVTTARLAASSDAPAVGAVLFHQDGRALLVMQDLPGEGRDFQAWGVLDGRVTSLGAFEGRMLQVELGSYEAIAVSLEPDGGSPEPTNVLGSAGRS